MSRRRKRGSGGGGAAVATAPQPQAQPQPARPAIPQYKWRTFPVYFAFWLGALIFLELGIIAGATGDSTFTTVISVIVAMFLGFGVARLAVVFMMSRQWIKPRPKAKRR